MSPYSAKPERYLSTATKWVREYLDLTGLSIDTTLKVVYWLVRDPLLSADTLGEERYREYMEVDARILKRGRYALALSNLMDLPPYEARKELDIAGTNLPEGEAVALGELYETAYHFDLGSLGTTWLEQWPPHKTDREREKELKAIARDVQASTRESRIATLLTTSDGVRHPDLLAWAAADSESRILPYMALVVALERLARGETRP